MWSNKDSESVRLDYSSCALWGQGGWRGITIGWSVLPYILAEYITLLKIKRYVIYWVESRCSLRHSLCQHDCRAQVSKKLVFPEVLRRVRRSYRPVFIILSLDVNCRIVEVVYMCLFSIKISGAQVCTDYLMNCLISLYDLLRRRREEGVKVMSIPRWVVTQVSVLGRLEKT